MKNLILKKSVNDLTLAYLALFLLLGFAPAALAQQTAEPPQQAVTELEEIIVTARRRAESIQDIPLAITAFTKQDLEKRSITELEDIARFTAGFSFEDFDGGNGSPVIRGQTTISRVAREQTTAVFLDGVYLPRSWLVDLGTDGFERIEIAKGPQSARFGRNAFAGAINYLPQKASAEEFGFEASIVGGTDERQDFGASINVPIVADKFAIRASFNDSEYDGSWENDHPFANAGISPGTDGNVGGWDSQNASLNALITPNERLTIDLSYFSYEREEEARASARLSASQGFGNCGNQLFGNFRLICGELPDPSDAVTIDPRGFSRQSDADIYRAFVEYSLSEQWNVSYLYGKIEADTIAAVSFESDSVGCGTILTPFIFQGFASLCNFQSSPLGDVDYDSHEMRFAFEGSGKLRGAFGLYFSDGLDNNLAVSSNPIALNGSNTAPIRIGTTTTFNAPPFTPPFNPAQFSNLVFRNTSTTTEVSAVFGEIGYKINDASRLSIEARYTEEEITSVNNIARPGTTAEFNDTFDFFTPRLSYEYDLNDNSLLYVSAARGAKAGGFNTGIGIAPEFATFEPEFNWTYELGSKNVFADGRVIANFALFLSNWEDQQINSRDPSSSDPLTTVIVRNLGNISTWGVEYEGAFQVSENLSFDTAFSYNDAKFDGGTFDQVYAFPPSPCDDIVCNSNGNISGNEIPGAPKLQFAAGAQYQGELPQWSASYSLRADVAYQDSFFADTINVLEVSDRTVVNASAALNFDHFEVRLWARNLFDQKYVSNSLQIIQNAPNQNIFGGFYGERRAAGITATYRF